MPLLGKWNLADNIKSAVLTWEYTQSYLILYNLVKKALPCLSEILFLPSSCQELISHYWWDLSRLESSGWWWWYILIGSAGNNCAPSSCSISSTHYSICTGLAPQLSTLEAFSEIIVQYRPVTLLLLLPSKHIPHFGVLGLILCEALNKERAWCCAHEGIFRCLNGQHHHNSQSVAAFNNPDHWNPFRHKTVATTLLKINLPAPRLASWSGLSNLLTMGTGQGFQTCRFLEHGS